MAQPEPENEECSCDICAPVAAYHALSTEEKFRQAWGKHGQPSQDEERYYPERSLMWWRKYSESLELDNYNLNERVCELERELAEEQARCSHCGRHR